MFRSANLRPQAIALACLIGAPLALSSSASQAAIDVDSQCRIKSRYQLEVDAGRIELTRKEKGDETAMRIEMAGGSLWVNGDPVPLTVADRERVEQFQESVEAMVPKIRLIARDSIDIAFEALSKVAVHFASPASQKQLLGELTQVREEALTLVANARSSNIDEGLLESRIEAAVARLVPVIVGEITTQAVSAAMSGDESVAEDLQRRGEQLERDIEASVEASAKALEKRVATLCPEIEALDRLDNAFEWRLPGGDRPELLSYAPPSGKADSPVER